MPVDQDAKGSDPTAEHKRRARWRLFGALILMGSVAAIAPILLNDEARPLSQDLLIEMPSRSSAPTAAPAPPPAAVVVAPAPEPALKPAPEPALKPAPEPAVKPAPEPALKPAPEPAKASVPPVKGFMVQVGAYSSLDTANRVKTRLEASGHRVLVQTIKAADGTARHRVRIGPFETRDQAGEVRDRAKLQGYDAVVVTAS